jgi:hypothetical protein
LVSHLVDRVHGRSGIAAAEETPVEVGEQVEVEVSESVNTSDSAPAPAPDSDESEPEDKLDPESPGSDFSTDRLRELEDIDSAPVESELEPTDEDIADYLVESGIPRQYTDELINAGLCTPNGILEHDDLTKIHGIGKKSRDAILKGLAGSGE